MTPFDPVDISAAVLITLTFTLAMLRVTHHARRHEGLRSVLALSGVACLTAYGAIAALCFWPHHPMTSAAGWLLLIAGLRFVLVVARRDRWGSRLWRHLSRCPYDQARKAEFRKFWHGR